MFHLLPPQCPNGREEHRLRGADGHAGGRVRALGGAQRSQGRLGEGEGDLFFVSLPICVFSPCFSPYCCFLASLTYSPPLFSSLSPFRLLLTPFSSFSSMCTFYVVEEQGCTGPPPPLHLRAYRHPRPLTRLPKTRQGVARSAGSSQSRTAHSQNSHVQGDHLYHHHLSLPPIIITTSLVITSCRVISLSCHVMSCHIVSSPYYLMSSQLISCHIISCPFMSFTRLR